MAVPTVDDFGEDAPWEPEYDGVMLEKQMKSFLQQQAASTKPATGNATQLIDNQEEPLKESAATDSPRFDTLKSAELRQPPTTRSRQGYRAFRMPTRPISPNVAG